MSAPHEPSHGRAGSVHLGRRSVVLGAVAGIGLTGLPGIDRSAASPRGSSAEAYAVAAWRPLVGDVLPSSQGPVLLAAITEQHHAAIEAFRLRFVTRDGRRLMSDQLVIHHPRHERVTFLVTTSGATGVAVVTRRRS